MKSVLVQNIETFETITTLPSVDAFDTWLDNNSNWGIVSMEQDADGEYEWVALLAAESGPDFVMDETTGEMEPVEDIDAAAELAAKMDIMLEMDMNDASQEDILAMIAIQDNAKEEVFISEETGLIVGSPEHKEAVAKELHDRMLAEGQAILDEWTAKDETTITSKKPRKSRKKSTTKSKGVNMTTPKKIRNFEILCAFIEARPGVSRTDVFQDPGLLTSLRTMAQIQAIANGDKAEIKRWNRRLNFLIRESKRQGVDIQIERKGRVAHYTIPANTDGQLELPFDEAAEARNAAVRGDDVTDEVVVDKPKIDPKRATEAPDQNLSFESLLATLDEDEATITSDDQVAFDEAMEMLK